MIRAVLAVVVATALLGTAAPALSEARGTLTAEAVVAETRSLERTAADLTATAAAVDDPTLAAGRTTTFDRPQGVSRVPLDVLAIGAPSDVLAGSTTENEAVGDTGVAGDDAAEIGGVGTDTAESHSVRSDGVESGVADEVGLVYRIEGNDPRLVPVPGVELRTPDGPVRIAEPTTRLRLTYLRADGDAVVSVTSAERSRDDV